MLNPWSSAWLVAQAGGGQPSQGFNPFGLVPMLLLFAIMYFLLIRPQQVKAKEHREMVSRLKAGDKVVTNGGIRGEITNVRDKSVTVKVADKVQVEFVRTAIHTVESDDEDEGDGKGESGK